MRGALLGAVLLTAVLGAGLPAAWLGARSLSGHAHHDHPEAPSAGTLESFDDPAAWVVQASDDVRAQLRAVDGIEGRALALDFDFRGRAGHAGLRRVLELDWPENFELSLYVKGKAPPNDLQLKLIDASGDNVWWLRQPELQVTPEWTRLRFQRRQLEFAWGPAQDRTLRHTAALELVLAAGRGGQGSVSFDALSLQELPPPPALPSALQARASSSAAGAPPELALDGSSGTAWQSAPGAGAEQRFELDLGVEREFGGLTLEWAADAEASSYDVELSRDGASWQRVRRVEGGNGGRDALRLPEARARWLRLVLHAGPAGRYALSEVRVEPLTFGEWNGFVSALGRAGPGQLPRGQLPRAFAGEQNTWTLVGVDGGPESALISEDGALEIGAGGFSIEPFLVVGSELWSWANVELSQSLREGYLPIPSVTWQRPGWQLRVTAWAQAAPERSAGSSLAAQSGVLAARYELENQSAQPLAATLVLAVRPLQVNPPTQSLNLRGGVSPIRALDWDGRRCRVNGERSVELLRAPDHVRLRAFDADELPVQLSVADPSGPARVSDPAELATGLFGYELRLAPGQRVQLGLLAPLDRGAAALTSVAELEPSEAAVAASWREQLARVQLTGPPAAQPVIDTLRSSLAYILISRAGPVLRPGTRSYARSWIRDGALMSKALLQLGHAEVAASYFDWYAPQQFESGKVPCCVDARGADPVAEHDSPGELIFLAAELYRFTADRARLERAWPHVEAAAAYLDRLRATQRTPENQLPERRAYYGLLPPSISHEGYSDKPAYSYWDDFWALIGYQDAAWIAELLGKQPARERLARSRAEFRADLYASLRECVARHGLDFIPASADRADLDPTATTLALTPGREQAALPQEWLQATFERYWQDFEARRSGTQSWDAYTPYELRIVGSFVRLGWRERAEQLARYFLADRWPVAWNQWAEVVGRDPRQPRFVGDRPHAWVASDYIRSTLDRFAYARESDQTLVLAAGIPHEWLDNSGIRVRGLRTPYGALDYSAVQVGQDVRIEVRGNAPPGGFALPWLWNGSPAGARATLNGAPLRWQTGELRFHDVPARIVIERSPGG